MSSTRHGPTSDRRARVSLGALVLTVATLQTDAAADGETTPMVGASVAGARAPEHEADLVGVSLEGALWRGRFGLALEGSMRWSVGADAPRSTILGGSARIRVFECLLPSLVDAREVVELGIEAQGIVERVWRDNEEFPSYGVGLAARLRGGGDEFFSTLLAESRVFVRVMSTRRPSIDIIARATTPTMDHETHDLTILIGIGASFGAGEPGYVQRFHTQPYESPQ